jgi:hypothetical protein
LGSEALSQMLTEGNVEAIIEKALGGADVKEKLL